jgi:hypothetical protein
VKGLDPEIAGGHRPIIFGTKKEGPGTRPGPASLIAVIR